MPHGDVTDVNGSCGCTKRIKFRSSSGNKSKNNIGRSRLMLRKVYVWYLGFKVHETRTRCCYALITSHMSDICSRSICSNIEQFSFLMQIKGVKFPRKQEKMLSFHFKSFRPNAKKKRFHSHFNSRSHGPRRLASPTNP